MSLYFENSPAVASREVRKSVVEIGYSETEY